MMELTAFLHKLKFYRPKLTKQQVRTLKGQALADNIKGAEKGLSKILEGAVLKVGIEMVLDLIGQIKAERGHAGL